MSTATITPQNLEAAETARRQLQAAAIPTSSPKHSAPAPANLLEDSLVFPSSMSEREKKGWREAVRALRDLVGSLENQLQEARGWLTTGWPVRLRGVDT